MSLARHTFLILVSVYLANFAYTFITHRDIFATAKPPHAEIDDAQELSGAHYRTLGIAVEVGLFSAALYGGWVVDFVVAFVIGVGFQYFTIVPVRHLSVRAGLAEALRADALSLTAWQLGMYGWMAVAVFLIFGRELPKSSAIFWFMMQIAMCAGFLTGYPVNWWLLRSGIKEVM